MSFVDKSQKRIVIFLCLIGVFVIVTLSLSAATLATLNQRFNSILEPKDTPKSDLKSVLAETIHIDDLMKHLRQLQRIANESNGTRAIGTIGFNRTLDYIDEYLKERIPEFAISRETFAVRNFGLESDPFFSSSINNVVKNYSYSPTTFQSDFAYVTYSNSTRFSDYVQLFVVSGFGCESNDWKNATGLVAIVKAGGSCTYAEKGILAAKYGARALLFYNDGRTASNQFPILVRLRLANQLPALYLSYAVGQSLVDASSTSLVKVKLIIELKDLGSFPVDNICADTPSGDEKQIIVVGSHSDSVLAGPGINDNGSGTAANLVVAENLARLFRTSAYKKYEYRVRFCWWAAEEIGLAGSSFHVAQALKSDVVGKRLRDYLINLNFDMAASPNFIFGIYNAKTAPSETPDSARAGSEKVTSLYRQWLIEQNLPWDFRDFNGRSDYGPFLAAGLAAGGVATGSDAIKTEAQRKEYRRLVGEQNAGFAGAILDPCYHLACDNIDNIHQFGYEKLVQLAAYGLEYLGQHPNLSNWLYPNGRPTFS